MGSTHGDIAKLPGGGREGAAVLCELVPDQLMEERKDGLYLLDNICPFTRILTMGHPSSLPQALIKLKVEIER